MENISLLAFVLSVLGSVAAIFGTYVSAKSVRDRISAERDLASEILKIYKKNDKTDEISKIIFQLETGENRAKNLESLDLYLKSIEQALIALEDSKREAISSAIHQDSEQGRLSFLSKLAKEINSLKHA